MVKNIHKFHANFLLCLTLTIRFDSQFIISSNDIERACQKVAKLVHGMPVEIYQVNPA